MALSVRVQSGAALSGKRGAVADAAAVRSLMTRAARAALRRAGITDAEMSVTLLDDGEIAAMNDEFLAHAGPTDVISFALYDDSEDPVGDIYVGYEQVLRQAAANGVAIDDELARVTIHGVLHVLGYDHPDGVDRLDSEMWLLQEDILKNMRTS